MDSTEALKKQNVELTAEIERLREQALQLADITRAYQESQNRFRAVFEACRIAQFFLCDQRRLQPDHENEKYRGG